jgi:hypothetical protein
MIRSLTNCSKGEFFYSFPAELLRIPDAFSGSKAGSSAFVLLLIRQAVESSIRIGILPQFFYCRVRRGMKDHGAAEFR